MRCSTELYALLSALSGLPLRQDVAVTGSVDQYGNVQAVGGVTDKIEGFFTACKTRGLTGGQGVMVPAANVRHHLMLANEVVEAARRRDFHVWAVRTIDEGIELLTGRECADVHRLVQDRLNGFAERLRALPRSTAFAVNTTDSDPDRRAEASRAAAGGS